MMHSAHLVGIASFFAIVTGNASSFIGSLFLETALAPHGSCLLQE
ncbi:hypothetical protein [Asaia astilbis]|nr:hypothetical protein [Asaia astilbis]